MSTFDEELKRLEKELLETEESIGKANADLADAQTEVKRLAADKVTLQHAREEITVGQEAIRKQREAAAQVQADAQKSCADLLARLEKLLSKEHRDRIAGAIESVDKEISDQREKASDLARQVAGAAQAAAGAKDEAAKCEIRLREIQAELNGLPAKITAAQGRVAKLKSDAQEAADNGRASDAYILATDLQQALDDLQELIDPTGEKELRNNLVKLQAELGEWNDKAGQAAAELEQLKRDQAAAEQQYQARVRERDEAIKKKLAESAKDLV
jgi:chromosome segregation ATPase